ncbi:hypothetical protein L3Q82_020451 [Scortum barcoo]|uniref:Uncharacterized protein n=1 Tax=Scortum barcoo TaxID=214431 RepID=A0ACB8V7V8_9TELE|nr:hypothetical protein L3Q82_020451 [Scortum barcoo]
MERTCSEMVTLRGSPPLLDTELLRWGGQIFIQLSANTLYCSASSQCLSSPIFWARVCCLLIINSPTTGTESQRFAELEPRRPTLSISLKGWAKPLLYGQCHRVLKPLLLLLCSQV